MQELKIYSRTGWVVGWQVGNVLYDITGQARAFLGNLAGEDANVFSFDSEDGGAAGHLGSIRTGYFRDHFGDAVAFMEGAHDGPPLPDTLQPAPELPGFQELPPRPQNAPSPYAAETPQWSENAWNAFLHGHTAYRGANR